MGLLSFLRLEKLLHEKANLNCMFTFWMCLVFFCLLERNSYQQTVGTQWGLI